MLFKIGDTGRNVKEVQTLLNFHGFWTYHTFTTTYGNVTATAVKAFQKAKGLKIDGEVGDITLNHLLRGVDTDKYTIDDTIVNNVKPVNVNNTANKHDTQDSYVTKNGLTINKAYLDSDEYVREYGKIEPLGFFIHHTAGWDNPYNTVTSWNTDTRGRVATQYVIGGSNVTGKKSSYDGVVVEAFPNNYLGWHLGKVGNFDISKYSGGVELTNFGYLTKKGDKYYTYVNTEVNAELVCDLGYKFRGHQYWHKYTDNQIESLRLLLLHLLDIYPKIDLVNGLPKLLKSGVAPADAFEFNTDAYNAKQFGLWTHTNVRKDKFDCFPQPELVEMLKQL